MLFICFSLYFSPQTLFYVSVLFCISFHALHLSRVTWCVGICAISLIGRGFYVLILKPFFKITQLSVDIIVVIIIIFGLNYVMFYVLTLFTVIFIYILSLFVFPNLYSFLKNFWYLTKLAFYASGYYFITFL